MIHCDIVVVGAFAGGVLLLVEREEMAARQHVLCSCMPWATSCSTVTISTLGCETGAPAIR
jgi:hypothetical protein